MNEQATRQIKLAVPAAERATVPVADSGAVFPVHRIYCVGRNYAEHAREMGDSDREPPFFFAKPADAVTCAEKVPYPPMTSNLHHEVELAVAMASGGSNIDAQEALSRVFGYAVAVDLTRRDVQALAKQKAHPWTCAKGFDHSAPISPIRVAGDCKQPQIAAISLAVNGATRQQGNTGDMIWSVAEIIAELSRYFELQAGDLILTGTPAGVGPLQVGDRVSCRIEGVADLAFSIEPATY